MFWNPLGAVHINFWFSSQHEKDRTETYWTQNEHKAIYYSLSVWKHSTVKRKKPNMESVKYTRHKTKKASFEVHKEEYTSEIDLFSTQEILRKCVL